MKPRRSVGDGELDRLLSGRIRSASKRFDRKAIEMIRDQDTDRERDVVVFPRWIPAIAGLAAALAVAVFIAIRQPASPKNEMVSREGSSEIAYAPEPLFEELFDMDTTLAPAAITLNPDFLETLHSLSGEPL